jgi:site-specific DNA-methyltransferase (adenine-specific)
MNKVFFGDCVQSLRALPEKIVHTCVTSPPYFGLRDYGHEGQIGLEQTPDEYVAKLVEVFREVRRVLRDDGTCWVNLGDSYGATGGDTHSGSNQRYSGTGGEGSKQDSMLGGMKGRKNNTGLRPKNLLGIPWRVALALQADGWYLRQDIIWAKKNCMPESVTDRCTKSHEYIFLLSKNERYYFDYKAIREEQAESSKERAKYGWNGRTDDNSNGARTGSSFKKVAASGGTVDAFIKADGLRNKRSVWNVSTKPYKGAHFATFPPDLITPCVLAGAPPEGTVLDPFMGSGTTAMVAVTHGRRYIGCELNPAYEPLQEERIYKVFADMI